MSLISREEFIETKKKRKKFNLTAYWKSATLLIHLKKYKNIYCGYFKCITNKMKIVEILERKVGEQAKQMKK